MKKAAKHTFVIVLAIWISFSIMSMAASIIPWYTQEEPLKIMQGVHNPGQKVPITIIRESLLGMEAKNVIELVHLHDGKEREIYKYTKDIYLQKGKGIIEVFYDIPPLEQCPQLKTNTYMFRGIITYNPFGYLNRSFEWATEKFRIEVNEEHTIEQKGS